MKPQDLDRIRFVTRHFDRLQGLRGLAPFGLILAAIGVCDPGPNARCSAPACS